jgi:hypothetical protein
MKPAPVPVKATALLLLPSQLYWPSTPSTQFGAN